jgi:predicted dehydrogenase
MATGKIRVGIIGANVRTGWGRDAHIPALSALPEFEITAGPPSPSHSIP